MKLFDYTNPTSTKIFLKSYWEEEFGVCYSIMRYQLMYKSGQYVWFALLEFADECALFYGM